MNFKIGDYVILIDPIGIHTLEIFKTYQVIDVDKNSNGDQVIAVEESKVTDNKDWNYYEYYNWSSTYRKKELDYNEYLYFNSKRFRIDLKPLRKMKINKIYEAN
jgi:hypothetical protein